MRNLLASAIIFLFCGDCFSQGYGVFIPQAGPPAKRGARISRGVVKPRAPTKVSTEWDNAKQIDAIIAAYERSHPSEYSKNIDMWHMSVGDYGWVGDGITFAHFIDDDSCYVTDRGRHRLKIVEMDVKQYADGELLPNVALEIVDTDSYKSVNGDTSEIFVAKPTNRNCGTPQRDRTDGKTPLPYPRKWRSKTHDAELLASYYELNGDVVTLVTPEYKRVHVPLELLDESDQRRIGDLVSMKKHNERRALRERKK